MIRRLVLGGGCLAVGMLAVGLLASCTSDPAGSVTHRNLVVVAGQSNAMGIGSFAIDPVTGINYLDPPYATPADTTDPLYWIVGWVKQPPAGSINNLDTPQVNVYNPAQGAHFGPEVGLARQAYADSPVPITIVKSTWPDNSLASGWNPSVPNGIYTKTIAMVKSRISTDSLNGQIDTIIGFYWYQGESDAISTAYSSSYRVNLTNLITHVRLDLGSVRFVIAKESIAEVIASKQMAGICPDPDCAIEVAGDKAVRAADDWAVANRNDVREVDSLGLPRWTDHMHLTNQSELTLGALLAKAGGL